MEIETQNLIYISKELENKLDYLTKNYSQEIAGFLIGEIKDGSIILEDLLIYEQEVGGASVDCQGKSLIKLRKEYKDKCLKIIGHFHSHNTMGAFWSETDENFIKEFSEPREISVFIVGSKNSRHLVRIELKKPFKMSLNSVEYEVIEEPNKELENFLKKEIKNKVTEKTLTYYDYSDNWSEKENSRKNKTGYKSLFDYDEDYINYFYPNSKKQRGWLRNGLY